MQNERTIPTKDQVLEAAERCPQIKQTLEILFPEDFKPIFKNKPSILYLPVATSPSGESELVLYRKELRHLFTAGWVVSEHGIEAITAAKEAGITDLENWMGYYTRLKSILK